MGTEEVRPERRLRQWYSWRGWSLSLARPLDGEKGWTERIGAGKTELQTDIWAGVQGDRKGREERK